MAKYAREGGGKCCLYRLMVGVRARLEAKRRYYYVSCIGKCLFDLIRRYYYVYMGIS